MSPTKYCPAIQQVLRVECTEGDGHYCEGYCPYAPQPEDVEDDVCSTCGESKYSDCWCHISKKVEK